MQTQSLRVLTTSSEMTNKLNSFAMSAMASSSSLVKTFPTGLWGVLSRIIFVLEVIARLGGAGGSVQDPPSRGVQRTVIL